eukprot:TRINITY_DN27391_c0_g1_i2.p1 TRINITY_DN27391_c0_g1~~TRINITY_DN27391_c0_g1_i2.p1  ORF type:complete len:190 (-),score=43.22 TRINITY_DN27391_c0_g1_i2:292-861(-)
MTHVAGGEVPNQTSSQGAWVEESHRTNTSDETPRSVVFETPRELTEEEMAIQGLDNSDNFLKDGTFLTAEQKSKFDEAELIFSKGRNNRYEEVEQSILTGFSPNSVDRHGNTLLMIACQNGLKRIAKLVLRHGVDMNMSNNRGHTALHYCFQYGYETLGEYLITKGADPTLCNNAGLTCRQGLGRSKDL